jgi:hypothetical protein
MLQLASTESQTDVDSSETLKFQNQEYINIDFYEHSDTTNTDQIIIKEAGMYIINYNVSAVCIAAQASSFRTWITKDGNAVESSYTYDSAADNIGTGGEYVGCSASFMIDVTAYTVIELWMEGKYYTDASWGGPNANFDTIADQCWIQIFNAAGQSGTSGSSGSSGTSGSSGSSGTGGTSGTGGGAEIASPNQWEAAQTILEKSFYIDSTNNWNVSEFQVATITLTDNITIQEAIDQKAGGSYQITIINDSTSFYTVSWDDTYKWEDNATPALAAGLGERTIFVFVSDGTYMYGKVFWRES